MTYISLHMSPVFSNISLGAVQNNLALEDIVFKSSLWSHYKYNDTVAHLQFTDLFNKIGVFSYLHKR